MNMNENKYLEGYVAPVLEVITIEAENIVTASPSCPPDNPEGYLPGTEH